MQKKLYLILFLFLMLITSMFNIVLADKLPIEEHILDNGLKIYTLEDHTIPIITFQVWYGCGSRNEHTGITGISHILEHMSLMRTENLGPEEFSHIVKANGGFTNASTSYDFTAYYITIGGDKLELCCELYADCMQNFALFQEDFDIEIENIKEERRMRVDNSPYGNLMEEFGAAAYTAHPYQWPVIGWMSDIENITIDDVYDYHNTYYKPNNASIILIGNFKTDEAIKMIKKYFEDIPPNEEIIPIVTTQEPKQNGKRRVEYYKPNVKPTLIAGYHIPAIGHPDLYVLDIIEVILSGGKSSRLYKKLVYEEQKALRANSWISENKDPGLFNILLMPLPNVPIEEAEILLWAEIEKLKIELVSEKELQKVKNKIEANFIYRQETLWTRGYMLGKMSVLLSPEYFNTYLDNIRAITPDDIMRVANTYFNENNLTIAVQFPEIIDNPIPNE